MQLAAGRAEQELAGPIELRIVSAAERQGVKGHFAAKARPAAVRGSCSSASAGTAASCRKHFAIDGDSPARSASACGVVREHQQREWSTCQRRRFPSIAR